MNFAIEIYAHKPFSITPDTYFQSALWTNGKIIPEFVGQDIYRFAAIVTGDKRVAGIGRRLEYTLNSFPAGMGPIEARPAQYLSLSNIPADLSLSFQTNSLFNADILADHLGVRLINEYGKRLNIPLCQAGLILLWNAGKHCHIPLATFLQGKLFQKVS